MNDQMIFENYLLLLKSTIEVYIHGTLESTNEEIRKTLHDCLNTTIQMQNETYQKMTEKNWYQTENISKKEIEKILNKINQKG